MENYLSKVDLEIKPETGIRFGSASVTAERKSRQQSGDLITGGVRNCGCGKRPPLKNWVGKRFGALTVLSYTRKENGFHLWHCKCDCGKELDVRQSNLQNGWTKSCVSLKRSSTMKTEHAWRCSSRALCIK